MEQHKYALACQVLELPSRLFGGAPPHACAVIRIPRRPLLLGVARQHAAESGDGRDDRQQSRSGLVSCLKPTPDGLPDM